MSYTKKFKSIDLLAFQSGFQNLDIINRHDYINAILTSRDINLVSQSQYLNNVQKTAICSMIESNNESYTKIAREILLPLIGNSNELKFNNNKRVESFPKILLIGYHYSSSVRNGLFIAPPLGILRIQSFLKVFGFEVDFFDSQLDTIDSLYKQLKKKNYDVIGMSILHPPFEALNLAVNLRNISNALFIAGGQGAAFSPQLILENSPIDIVVNGFGEIPMLEIINNVIGKKSFDSIKGLYLKKSDSIKYTGATEPCSHKDLQFFSNCFCYKNVPYSRYWQIVRNRYTKEQLQLMKAENTVNTIRIYTETHCPMKCDFCSSTNFLDNAVNGVHKFICLKADEIFTLIKRASREFPDLEAIYFNDDEFLIDKRRVLKLCKMIRSDDTLSTLHYICMARVDNIDKNILIAMKNAHFSIISFGIETFSETILRDMNKKVKKTNGYSVTESMISAIKLTASVGIVPRINFIMFYPTIQLCDLQRTIEIATELIELGCPPTYYKFVELFPGARIMKKQYQKGYRYGLFKVGDQSIKYPVDVLPLDEEIKELALKSIQDHTKYLKLITQKYAVHINSKIPSSIDTLIFFYSIYRNAGLQTSRIEEAINNLLKADNIYIPKYELTN